MKTEGPQVTPRQDQPPALELSPGWLLVERPQGIETTGAPGHDGPTFSWASRVIAVGPEVEPGLVGRKVQGRGLGAGVPLRDRSCWAVPSWDLIGVWPETGV